MKGWLDKRGAGFGKKKFSSAKGARWKRRWCVIDVEAHALIYSEHAGASSPTPAHSINLGAPGTFVRVAGDPARGEFEFEIGTNPGNFENGTVSDANQASVTRIFRLRCGSEAEREAWMSALDDVVFGAEPLVPDTTFHNVTTPKLLDAVTSFDFNLRLAAVQRCGEHCSIRSGDVCSRTEAASLFQPDRRLELRILLTAAWAPSATKSSCTLLQEGVLYDPGIARHALAALARSWIGCTDDDSDGDLIEAAFGAIASHLNRATIGDAELQVLALTALAQLTSNTQGMTAAIALATGTWGTVIKLIQIHVATSRPKTGLSSSRSGRNSAVNIDHEFVDFAVVRHSLTVLNIMADVLCQRNRSSASSAESMVAKSHVDSILQCALSSCSAVAQTAESESAPCSMLHDRSTTRLALKVIGTLLELGSMSTVIGSRTKIGLLANLLDSCIDLQDTASVNCIRQCFSILSQDSRARTKIAAVRSDLVAFSNSGQPPSRRWYYRPLERQWKSAADLLLRTQGEPTVLPAEAEPSSSTQGWAQFVLDELNLALTDQLRAEAVPVKLKILKLELPTAPLTVEKIGVQEQSMIRLSPWIDWESRQVHFKLALAPVGFSCKLQASKGVLKVRTRVRNIEVNLQGVLGFDSAKLKPSWFAITDLPDLKFDVSVEKLDIAGILRRVLNRIIKDKFLLPKRYYLEVAEVELAGRKDCPTCGAPLNKTTELP